MEHIQKNILTILRIALSVQYHNVRQKLNFGLGDVSNALCSQFFCFDPVGHIMFSQSLMIWYYRRGLITSSSSALLLEYLLVLKPISNRPGVFSYPYIICHIRRSEAPIHVYKLGCHNHDYELHFKWCCSYLSIELCMRTMICVLHNYSLHANGRRDR